MNAAGPLTPDQQERLARYRAGMMSAEEREGFEREALANDALSDELFAEVTLDGYAVREGAGRVVPLRFRGARRRSAVGYMLPAAAAIAAVSLIWFFGVRTPGPLPDEDLVRGDDPVALLLEPVGTIDAAPAVFRWNASPSAAAYRVDLYDLEGTRYGTTVTADTVVALAALSPDSPAAAEWRVTALDDDGLEIGVLGRAEYRVSGTPSRP